MVSKRTVLVAFSCAVRKVVAFAAYAGILALFGAGVSSSVLADAVQDCQQSKDPKLQVQGCTQILNMSSPPATQAAARLFRGWAYVRLGQYDAAITDLTESIRISPAPDAYRLRGAAYEMLQRYDLAILDFSNAIQLKPDFVELYLYRGNCRLAKGDATGAIDDFSIVTEKKPEVPDTYYWRARANELLSQHDAAINDLTFLIDLDPKWKARALFYRALVNESQGRNDLAEADFKSAIGLSPRLELERYWVEYLKSIQADGDYVNWSDKPYDLYLRVGGF